jgi:competence protein ComEA
MRVVTFVVAAAACLLLASPLPVRAQEPKPDPVAKTTAALNLNTATLEQLEALPGIGRSTAQRILEHRQKNGGFKKIEDLMQVKGIGEKSFLKLKPMITVVSKADKPTGGA